MAFTVQKLDQIQAHLGKNPYLSEGVHPAATDAKIYFDLKEAPSQDKFPNTFYWYFFVRNFTDTVLKSWIQKAEGKTAKKEDGDDLFDEKKPAKKQKVKETGDDLFDDEPAGAAPVQKQKPKPKPKAKKLAKSIVVFEIKVYEQETDLMALFQKVKKIEMDGLVWNNEPKILPVAFGMNKLQMGCVIQDDKVLTDDLFEPIEEWQDVQSVDMVSMQKL